MKIDFLVLFFSLCLIEDRNLTVCILLPAVLESENTQVYSRTGNDNNVNVCRRGSRGEQLFPSMVQINRA